MVWCDVPYSVGVTVHDLHHHGADLPVLLEEQSGNVGSSVVDGAREEPADAERDAHAADDLQSGAVWLRECAEFKRPSLARACSPGLSPRCQRVAFKVEE
eukprot:CAMPEP_0173204238 /NCGR_PEP_ID=MMETSP1141-20130122/19992_1 /TAXON_ID=483371 /ORGANISM="non described non described, Strain CCMP2298" /LENGTH=99 /DNA_ID=CAMNT_0014129841 /DNA_START=593 /DNA_END=892 /DNA_ORIENTATION=+